MTDDNWDDVLDVNLTGAFHTIRRAIPKMMRSRFGRIVNVSSVGAHIGGAGQANYAAAKAGLLGLTRSVARELGSRGITCNVVAPGPIVTGMTEAMGEEWLAGVGALVAARPTRNRRGVCGRHRIPVLRSRGLRDRSAGAGRRWSRYGSLTDRPPATPQPEERPEHGA